MLMIPLLFVVCTDSQLNYFTVTSNGIGINKIIKELNVHNPQ